MNVNFEYYKIFYYVARYHNFTKAAKVLGNSQPNVTRAMNCLEQQLGRILFVRTNRGVQLTRDGEQLYSYVEAAMSQLLTAEDELADGENLTHGSITIGVSETALNIYLLDRLRAFHMAYPGINLKIYNHSTPQAVEEVKNGSIDFAVVTTPADVEAPLKAATTDQILPLVKCELGLAFIPELMAREAVKNKEVVKLSLEEKLPDRNVCLVYDCLHPLNEAAKQFKKIIVESR